MLKFSSGLLALVTASAGLAENGGAACDRQCLSTITEQYVAAMIGHDPSAAPWAENVQFTENNVVMPVGDGLWGTITGGGTYKLYLADANSGQAGFFGVVEEGKHLAVYTVRLKVRDRRIAEAETIVARTRDDSPGFPNPAGLTDKPEFSAPVPLAQRATREDLIAVADGYFATLQQNDGTLHTAFTEDCDRVEGGVHTTNKKDIPAGAGNAFPAMGCEAQFKTGYFKFVTRIRNRRYPLVDTERGLVLAAAFFDHDGSMTSVTLTDGTTRKIGPPFDSPYSFVIFELFKIERGKIRRVEAVFEGVPYSTKSAW